MNIEIDEKTDAYIEGVRVGKLTAEGKLDLHSTDDGSSGFHGTVTDLLKFLMLVSEAPNK